MTLKPVTKDEFFAHIAKMNVHPRSEPDASYWELPNRTLIGKSTPGWKIKGPHRETQFFLAVSA